MFKWNKYQIWKCLEGEKFSSWSLFVDIICWYKTNKDFNERGFDCYLDRVCGRWLPTVGVPIGVSVATDALPSRRLDSVLSSRLAWRRIRWWVSCILSEMERRRRKKGRIKINISFSFQLFAKKPGIHIHSRTSSWGPWDHENYFVVSGFSLCKKKYIYSASQKKQNPETMECCEQVVGCMTIIIYISWIMINMLLNDT